MQLSNLAAQAVLPRSDVSTGMALNFFAQQLGGAIFIPVAQNVFASGIISKLNGVAGLDPQVIVDTGATDLHNVVPARALPVAVNAFNYGVTRTFLVSVGLSAGTLLAASVMEWKNIKKGEKKESPKDAEKDAEKAEKRDDEKDVG